MSFSIISYIDQPWHLVISLKSVPKEIKTPSNSCWILYNYSSCACSLGLAKSWYVFVMKWKSGKGDKSSNWTSGPKVSKLANIQTTHEASRNYDVMLRKQQDRNGKDFEQGRLHFTLLRCICLKQIVWMHSINSEGAIPQCHVECILHKGSKNFLPNLKGHAG